MNQLAPLKLRPHNRRPRGRPALQLRVRLRGILQRIGVVDRHVEFAVDDGSEQRVGAFEQLLAGRDVVVELRPDREP